MSRRHYLITYDIADDKRRNRVFQALQDHGNHTQYSVFLCQLTPMELASLRSRLHSEIHQRNDQILVVDLGLAEHELDDAIESLGRAFIPTPRAFIV